MACETACPSGVRYAPLIEETRAAIEHHHQRSAGDRLFRSLLFQVLPYPARLRLLSRCRSHWSRSFGECRPACLPAARIRNLVALAPAASHATTHSRAHASVRSVAAQRRPRHRMRAAVFFGHVNEATVRVLAAEGCEVLSPLSAGVLWRARASCRRRSETRASSRKQLIASFETRRPARASMKS